MDLEALQRCVDAAGAAAERLVAAGHDPALVARALFLVGAGGLVLRPDGEAARDEIRHLARQLEGIVARAEAAGTPAALN